MNHQDAEVLEGSWCSRIDKKAHHLLSAWLQDGSREGRFSNAHCGGKVTALSFDKNQRRLLTAGNDATIKLWNFNNGSLLRRCGSSCCFMCHCIVKASQMCAFRRCSC
jgi:WD40 repeat protein